jgi:predicted dehydrogenase
MKRIGVGIIGSGAIAERAHIPSYLRTPECRLIAIADNHLERAKDVAHRYGVPDSYSNHEDLLSSADINAVSVCTPPSTHCEIVLEACRKGKHVLCEKPLALSLREADEMINAAKKAGVILSVGHQLRFMPNVLRSRELLKKKAIGRVLTCYGQWGAGSVFFGWTTASDYYLKPESGIDAILNYGTHVLDLFNFLFGDPLRVCGFMGQGQIKGVTLSDRAAAVIEYENVLAVLDTFYAATECPGGNFVEIHGFDGRLTFWLNESVLSFYSRSSIVNKFLGVRRFTVGRGVDYLYPYTREVKDFIDAVRLQRSPSVTGEDGRKALELALATFKSYETKQTITLPMDR